MQDATIQSRRDLLTRLAQDPEVYARYCAAVRGEVPNVPRLSSANSLRYARPLPEDAEKMIDDAIVRVGRNRLRVAAAIRDAGLTKPLPNWLATLNIQQDRQNEWMVAEEMYDLRSPGELQLPDRSAATIPVFAQVSWAQWGVRELMASQQSGAPFDTDSVEQGVRRINELIENQCINGSTLNIGGNTAAGLLNAPNVNTWNFESGLAWDNAAKTGNNIRKDVITGVNTLRDANRYGPYNLFINDTYESTLQNRFDSTSGSTETIQQAIEVMFGGINIVAASQIPANTVILAEMSSDVMDMIVGDEPTATNWSDTPGFVTWVAIIACMILRVKDDYDGNSGIAIGTPS